VPPGIQTLFDARAAGTINVATPLTDTSDLIKSRSRPEWRATASLTWSLKQFQVGGFVNFISEVNDTSFLDANGVPYVVDSQTTFNLYAQYRIKDGALKGTRFRVGARNLFNAQPPLAGDGYLGALYNPYGRYLYATVGIRL
jgi:iron complex outermembrane recepter protein